MSHAILSAVREHITGLQATDDATVLDLVRELLQRFDDVGAEGLDSVATAHADINPDALDDLFHLGMIAKHGARADDALVESLAFAAYRETALTIASEV